MKNYWVYILASTKNGTLYIGVTGDLLNRISQHKKKMIDGFTKKYNITLLVYFEEFGSVYEAINREKSVKKWNRTWKLNLIKKQNPNWEDLYENIL